MKKREERLRKTREYYAKNKEKVLKYQAEYNQKNRDIILKRHRLYCEKNKVYFKNKGKEYRDLHKTEEYVKCFVYREKRRLWLEQFKESKGCYLCESKEKLEYHHINPNEKEFKLCDCKKSWDLILDEVQKCVVLCNSCHHRIHDALRFGHPFPLGYDQILMIDTEII
jgi:hypothetical protein